MLCTLDLMKRFQRSKAWLVVSMPWTADDCEVRNRWKDTLRWIPLGVVDCNDALKGSREDSKARDGAEVGEENVLHSGRVLPWDCSWLTTLPRGQC